MSTMSASSSSVPVHALQARVKKLLGSRAELESTRALLQTLVTSDAFSTGTGTTAADTQSLAELRLNLRASLEHKQLALAESALQGLQQTLTRVSALRGSVDALDSKCGAIQSFLESTKRETQQVQAEAATLAAQTAKVQSELAELERFLAQYQLQPDEVQGLYTPKLADEDVTAFLGIMGRVQVVKDDCRALVTSGEVTCALELLDAVGKYQEVGFDRLYQWTATKCAQVEGEPSTQLHAAITLLRDRSDFYNYCKESLMSSRRSLIVQRFLTALTRGGPNGIPRPIEMYAHDPVRYCGDMLAWVHQAIATEHEFFRVLFDGDLAFTPSSSTSSSSTTNGLLPAPTEQEQHDEANINADTRIHDASTKAVDGGDASMVGCAFDGVARPLQVRIEQALAAPHGIVIAYKLVHLLAFYHHKFAQLMAHSGVTTALQAARVAANRAFQHQFRVLVDSVTSSAQDYSSNLEATHAVMEVTHRLATLLDVFHSSMVAEHEKEADVAPLLNGVQSAVTQMCKRTIPALGNVEAQVFQVNNLSCLHAPLARFPEARPWYTAIGDDLDQHLTAMSELVVTQLTERYEVKPILDKMDAYQSANTNQTSLPTVQPGLDGETISSVMEDFCGALMALSFPQFEPITQPELRERVRSRTVTELAAIYTKIYEFVEHPAHGYRTSHQTTAAMGGNQAILLHTPHQVRTVLEID